MSETAIIVKDVSKKYRLFDNAQDRLKEALHPFSKHYHREFWALRGISFEIPRGQTVGILGRNGSGKSTLLQIIAGIMQPTSGEVIVNGRISALLELGAGFNPEFTGRENAIFQAEVMGLRRDEIDRKLPEIEEFADIGEFFDQPVKVYSSGMFVRAAFATAISVDPDILIVDEALAVGDVSFQEKCYAKLRQFKLAGKTILFVSHSLEAITALCDHALIIDEHQLYLKGEPKEIADRYLQVMLTKTVEKLTPIVIDENSDIFTSVNCIDQDIFFDSNSRKDECKTRQFYNNNEVIIANGGASIIDYLLTTSNASGEPYIARGAEISLQIKVLYKKMVFAPVVGFELKTMNGITVYGTNTFMAKVNLSEAMENETRIYIFKFRMPLNSGDYFVDLGIAENDGSKGGSLLELRRSVIHLIIEAAEEYEFTGLIDLVPSFAECLYPQKV